MELAFASLLRDNPAMHITIVYLGKMPVPPPLYGGGQRVMFWLGKALVQLGHKVTLIANRDSHIPGVELRPLPDPECKDDSWAKLIPDTTDILHLRAPPKGLMPKPFVVTIGGNGRPGETFPRNTIFLSRNHAANHQSRHFVHNGLDPDEYQFSPTREDYAVFLAKASWDVKNVSGAIAVCRRAAVELHVIGSRNWPLGLHRLLPPIRGVHYHGRLGQREKIPLLAQARCLIFPVRWHEPYGNAVNEALVSGCYVAATPYGSLPEIVTSQVGVLSQRVEELAEVVKSPGRFLPQDCRNRVILGGLTHIDMARNYLAYYERVLATGGLGEKDEPAPATRPGFEANRLLDWVN
ncbi:MAG: glycosyltransferase [Akkermansiaceae bacterium]|nr:glycosyltransferase [Verrucomicrobiales bacterium]